MSKNKEFKQRIAENKNNMDFYNQDGVVAPQRKHFTKKKTYAPRIKPTSYVYTSDDENAFYDVLNRMCESCNIVDTFISGAEALVEDEDALLTFTSDEYFEIIAKYAVEKCMPKLLSKKFIHSMVSVSANKIYVKTEGNVSFSIELKYGIENGVAYVTSCTGTITLFTKNDILVNDLLNNGFEEFQRTKKTKRNTTTSENAPTDVDIEIEYTESEE